MAPSDDDLVITFIPALVLLLTNAEQEKGRALTEDEVLAIRDGGVCIALARSTVRDMAESRGYDDLDPEDVWTQWQQVRRGD